MDRITAERCSIIRAVTGSTAHGLNLGGTDDLDVTGVAIEDYHHAQGFTEFEQYIYRSAAEREGKHDAPSQPGDLDLTIYSLKKFLRLAMQGNPSVLLMLYVTDVIHRDARGAMLQELAPHIVSRQAGKRFLGYMESQRQRLLGERGQKKVNRPDLEAAHGYDTKYAMHIIRLGEQGVELMDTGRITLPMDDAVRTDILDIRHGKTPLNDVLEWAGELERELKDLLTTSALPEHPDREQVEDWMLEMYWQNWVARRTPTVGWGEAAWDGKQGDTYGCQTTPHPLS